MTRLRKQETSIVSLAILFTLSSGVSGTVASRAAASKSLAGSLLMRPILAEATSTSAFPLPRNVPVGTSIRIGGSSSMETINQALKQRFEQQFVGTKVELNTQGTGPAIKDLLDGNADLAAIGRTLMEQEKAQGLVPVPVSRHKIAIVVGSENPFKEGLTFEQFAKIFRGEIKDWAQVGGEPGPIRFIDRPDNSDTRQAFRNYAVFKQAPFVTGKTASQLAQDSTNQMVQALRTDGIGYAIADQLQGRNDVRIIPMHKTLPSNPKYPFSQPLIYVYKGLQPNPAAQAFLGYATAPVSRQTIETARKEATAAIATSEVASPSPKVAPSSQASPSASAPTAAPSPSAATDSANTAMWWLAIPLLGGLFWWLLKRNADASVEPALEADVEGFPAPTVDPVATLEPPTLERQPMQEPIGPLASMVPLLGTTHPAGDCRLILVPRDGMNADAYWEIPADAQAWLQQQGAQKLVLRLYDVTGIDLNQQPPISLQAFDCEAQTYKRHLPIQTADRTYLAELGYVVAEGHWRSIARSESLSIPACPPLQQPIESGAVLDSTVLDSTVFDPTVFDPTTPDSTVLDSTALVDEQASKRAHAPTPIDDALKSNGLALSGGTALADAATSTVLAADRDALYLPTDNSLVAADRTVLASHRASGDFEVAAARSGQAVGGEAKAMGRDRTLESKLATATNAVSTSFVGDPVPDSTSQSQMSQSQMSQSQIRLIPRTAHDLYVSWNAIQAEKDALKQQGGQQLVLRVYAITDADTALTHNVQQCFCNDWDHDQSVPIAVSNLDYVAELGYVTLDGRFLMLARSPQTRVPGA